MSITAYYAMADGKVIGDPAIKGIAAAHGKSEAQVVLRWLVQQDGVVALSKTVSEERAKSNFQIFDFELSAHEIGALHALAKPGGRIVNPRNLAPEWD
jgi:diketogulonate reductase-like aldo/keto reductase